VTEATYRSVNRAGWGELNSRGSVYDQPYGPEQFAHAQKLQLAEDRRWDGSAYRISLRPGTGPHPWPPGELGEATCWHYIHSIGDLLGGLCEAGFVIVRFDERGQNEPDAAPGSQEHLDGYLPGHFGILARRRMPG
jgi:hypothetical protein